MVVKKKLEKQLKHRRRQTNDLAEFSEIGNVTDDKLRREIGSLVDDLKLVDNNYLKFVKKHSKFGKDGVEGEYNKQMLEKARAERVKAQIERYQQTMARGVNGMAIAKIVGHVAINAVFNKQFRDDFKQLFRKPIERTAQNLAKSKGQNVVLGGLSNGTHVPFDARSAALTELAQTLKFNEDMRNTKDPAKREWLIKSYTESLGSLYEWADEDGVSGDSIRRMRNVLIDADLRSDHPKFKHLYENLHNVERDCQRVDFFEHMDVGVFVWEGDFKDSKTGDSFEMIVHAPEYGEPIDKIIDVDLEYGVESYIDEKAVVDDAVEISKAENDSDFEKRLNPNYVVLNWSDEKDVVVPEKIDFSKVKVEPLFKDTVDFETFSKSDFRAVKVKDCTAVKKSKKLLQFTLDDGSGKDRIILSGIHAFYEPEDLIGKTVIAIVNLPPRNMMGIDSCGMLLSAIHEEDGEEKLHLLMVDGHIPAGAKLY